MMLVVACLPFVRGIPVTDVGQEKLDLWENDRPRVIKAYHEGDDEVSAPVITLPMIVVPPRDQVPGSTKGMPYKVRVVHPHRKKRFSRFLTRRLSSERVGHMVDLHGGIVGVGEYFSVIEIGGKKIRVQIDTGSSTLAVPMKGCTSCIKRSNTYSIGESRHGSFVKCGSAECEANRCSSSCKVCSARGACCSSERPSLCGFSLRYADGSTLSGAVVRDVMRWGKLSTNVTFGGILRNSASFERAEVDGILGMAYRTLACNPSCFDPPFDAFVRNGLVEDVFSICMTGTGGKLMLGGFDARVARGRVRYVDMAHAGAERYYQVSLGGRVDIGGREVSMPNFRTAIVDTGTTLIVTSTRTFDALKQALQERYCMVAELCGADSWFQSGMCVGLSRRDLALLPDITLTVGGSMELRLRPEDYMLSYKRGARTYRCVGVMGMDGLGGMVVLGNTLMQRYVTVYDRGRGRIGFAEAADGCGA